MLVHLDLEVEHGMIHDVLNSDLDQLDEFAVAAIHAIDMTD